MMNDSSACIVDSNILVYQHDPRFPVAQRIATELFDHLLLANRAAFSVQSLMEFFNTVTRKLPSKVPESDAIALVERFARTAPVYPITAEVVLEAVRATTRYQMSLWDALIWSVAFVNGIKIILTEDAQSSDIIGGIRYVNPFAPEFDITSL